MKYFSLPNVLKFFKFVEEEWKLPVQRGLWHLQQCGWIGSAGGMQPWVQGVCQLLQLDHQADCPSTCSSILSPLRVTGIQWSG